MAFVKNNIVYLIMYLNLHIYTCFLALQLAFFPQQLRLLHLMHPIALQIKLENLSQ